MRRLVALVAVVGLSCLGLVSAGTAAGAKVVGANGQITFARFDPNVGDTVTFIANADGTGLRALFPGVQTGLPRWSPDESRLAIQAGLDNPCPPCAASTIILNPDTGSYRILSPKGGRRPWRCFYLSGLTYRETARARERGWGCQRWNTDQQMSFRNRWSSTTSSRIASGSWSRCHRHSSRPALSASPSGAAARAALIA